MIAVNIHETVRVDDELEIRAYYAGHVRQRLLATAASVVVYAKVRAARALAVARRRKRAAR